MKKQTKLWKTKDGTKIRICDMTDSHLLNTVKMLDKYSKNLLQILLQEAYTFESMVDPDSIGGYLLNDIICDLEEKVTQGFHYDWEERAIYPEIYYNLLKEANRRNLEIKEESNA